MASNLASTIGEATGRSNGGDAWSLRNFFQCLTGAVPPFADGVFFPLVEVTSASGS